MDKRFLLPILLLVGVMLWLFYTNRFEVESTNVLGKPAPTFEAKTLDGKTLRLQDVVGKKVILINFWATWCQPCQEEMPTLNAIYQSLDPNMFEMVSLMEDEAVDDAERRTILEAFNKKIPISFPVYADVNQLIADLYGTYKIPETYIIDLNGVVAEKVAGVVTESNKDELIAKIRKLAQKP